MIGLDVLPRPVEPEDREALARMFLRLSPQSVHRRFFTLAPYLSDTLWRGLVGGDGDGTETLVVAVGDEIVGVASYTPDRHDPTAADIAVLVEDGWQHRGVGRRLVRALVRRAEGNGIRRFHADVLPDNRPVISMIHRLEPDATADLADGTLAFDLPLHPAA